MNTDNMTISGETIDYGPCAFLDTYSPDVVFSSIDEGGRYAFSNQPIIAQWNLSRFAETLIPLVSDDSDEAIEKLTEVINTFPQRYLGYWLDGMRAKLGLLTSRDDDLDLVNALYEVIKGQGVDFTQFFRKLADAVRGDAIPARNLFTDPSGIDDWLADYQQRQNAEDAAMDERAAAMNLVNPVYIPRNHKVEEALSAAVNAGDFVPFHEMLDVLSRPFAERQGLETFAEPAPSGFGPYQTFCGT